jgi:hypothetical protein
MSVHSQTLVTSEQITRMRDELAAPTPFLLLTIKIACYAVKATQLEETACRVGFLPSVVVAVSLSAVSIH